MTFWSSLLLALAGLYLLSSIAPWLALTLLNRAMRRRVSGVPEIEARAQELDHARAQARDAFPEKPRPGAYAELDRQAQSLLAQLASEASRLDAQRTDLLFFSPTRPGLLGALLWGSWGPLIETLRVRSCLSRIDETLSGAERMLFQLEELGHQINGLARAPREKLSNALAGVTTLGASIEADRARGVLGIAVQPSDLEAVRSDLEAALERVDHDQDLGLQVAQIARQADTALARANEAMERMRAAQTEARLLHDAGRALVALRAALEAARTRVQGITADEGGVEQVSELADARSAAGDLLRRLESASGADLGAAVTAAETLVFALEALGFPRVQPEPEPEPEPEIVPEREIEIQPAAESEPEAEPEYELAQEPGEPEGAGYSAEGVEYNADEVVEQERLYDLPLGGYIRVPAAEAAHSPTISVPVAEPEIQPPAESEIQPAAGSTAEPAVRQEQEAEPLDKGLEYEGLEYEASEGEPELEEDLEYEGAEGVEGLGHNAWEEAQDDEAQELVAPELAARKPVFEEELSYPPLANERVLETTVVKEDFGKEDFGEEAVVEEDFVEEALVEETLAGVALGREELDAPALERALEADAAAVPDADATAQEEGAAELRPARERRIPFWRRRAHRKAAELAEAEALAAAEAAADALPLYERASADPAFQAAMQALQSNDHQGGLEALLALRRRYPEDPNLERVIEWATLRTDLKPKKTIRPRRWAFRWQRVVGSVVGLAVVGALGYYLVIGVQRYVVPILEERAAVRAYTDLVNRCNALLIAEKLDEAEPCYNEALASNPEDAEVQAALQDISSRRKLAMAYASCVSAYDSGDSATALTACMEVQRLAPNYRDVQTRILTITQRQRLQEIYDAAEQARADGNLQEALAGYEQLANLDTAYRAQEIKDARIELYLELGRAIISGENPQLDLLLTANNYFALALKLSPTHPEAQLERRLSSLFSEGVSRYQDGRWEDAIIRLRGVYDQRPTYFQQTLLSMLYDAYVKSGDQYRAADDTAGAYERYYQATLLPIVDRTAAELRLAEVRPFITPTPTPTPTLTPAPTFTPRVTPRPVGGGVVATPQPTAVATPRPLGAYAGQIVYRSLQAERPGYYVRDASGANPQYLGPSGGALDQQYSALLGRYMYSPDGRYRAFVAATGENTTAIFVELPAEERTADKTNYQLTNLNGKSWDPAWSPDGGRIVFVSNDTGNTDDIWIVNADGSGLRNLTLGITAWDKRPSWSPDGTRIVFWSNREGPMQLYVMSADGRNIRNISQTSWDETDPLWIR